MLPGIVVFLVDNIRLIENRSGIFETDSMLQCEQAVARALSWPRSNFSYAEFEFALRRACQTSTQLRVFRESPDQTAPMDCLTARHGRIGLQGCLTS
jgi:hypothetical protein